MTAATRCGEHAQSSEESVNRLTALRRAILFVVQLLVVLGLGTYYFVHNAGELHTVPPGSIC